MRLALGFMVLAMALRLGGADGFGTMRFDQRIGEKLPMGAVLTDETGHPVRLGDLAPRQPLLVIFGYFECTQLCSVVERRSAMSRSCL